MLHIFSLLEIFLFILFIFLILIGKIKLRQFKKETSKCEEECKRCLQRILGKPFFKVRPSFLINPKTGNRLELDCYNHDLRLALEYQGKQHYEFTPFFHKEKEDFLNQKERDEYKKKKCKELNITLIEVPYTVKYENIYNYIHKELLNKNFVKF